MVDRIPDAKNSSSSGAQQTASSPQLPPLTPPAAAAIIEVRTHRDLASAFREVARRVAAEPAYAAMFAINPVLALEAYGVRLTPELRDHVLRSVKNPAGVKSRIDALEHALSKVLGEPPRPENPNWLAHALFAILKLQPLETQGHEPVYEPPLNAAILARLAPLRPVPRRKYPPRRFGTVTSKIGLAPWQEKARFLDLTAAVPDLPQAQAAPAMITVDEAWFYKDTDPSAHDLVELGSLRRTGLLFHPPDSYRQIAAGTKPNVFRTWIRELRFKDPGH